MMIEISNCFGMPSDSNSKTCSTMKRVYRFLLLSITVIAISVTSCKDEDRVIVPEWETGVHGLATFSSNSAESFIKGDASKQLEIDLLWNSIDSKNTVTKI